MSELYTDQFFANRARHHSKVESAVQALLEILESEFWMYDIHSVIDVGCGDAHWLKIIRSMSDGIHHVMGIELNCNCLPYTDDIPVIIHDLREPLDLKMQFGLVICLEVAEHLEEEYAEQLVKFLASLANPCILFSAAHPGQGGIGHKNLQPPEYWLELFQDCGVRLDETTTSAICRRWERQRVMKWLVENVMFLYKGA